MAAVSRWEKRLIAEKVPALRERSKDLRWPDPDSPGRNNSQPCAFKPSSNPACGEVRLAAFFKECEVAQQHNGNARKFPELKTRIELEENEDLEVDEGFEFGTSDATGQRDQAFRSDRGVTQPLLIVLAVVALVAVASFLSI